MNDQKRGKKRGFESLEKREMLDGKGDVLPSTLVVPAPLYEVEIAELMSRANWAKSTLSTEFLRAAHGFMQPIIYGGSDYGDGGASSPNPIPADPKDSPTKRIDPNTSTTYGGVVGIEIDAPPPTQPNGGLDVDAACSGTVIAPTYVLTAAHCFDNRDAGGYKLALHPLDDPNTTIIGANGDGLVDPGTSAKVRVNNGSSSSDLITVDTITLHPSYFMQNGTFDVNGHDDLALVKLATPVMPGTPIYSIRDQEMSSQPSNPDRLELVGYGRTGWGDFGLPGSDPANPDDYDGINPTFPLETKRVGANLADFLFLCDDDAPSGGGASPCTGSNEEVYWFDFDDDTNLTGPGMGLGNTVEGMVAPGDSGGPAFYDTGTELLLAGVNTFQFNNFVEEGNWGVLGGGIILDPYVTWINNTIGVDVQLSASAPTVVAGPGASDTTVTYSVTVTNDGPNTATGINIADTITLPTGVSITNTPNWSVATLAPSASTTIDVVFEVDGATANAADSITIALDASSVEPELVGADNLLNDSLSLSSLIGVDVQLAGAVNSVVAGPGAMDTTVTYRVTVTNDGPNTATGISIADTITVPTGVTITNTPNWSVGTLAPSASTTIDVVFEVDGSTANSADSIAVGLNASSVETELASADNVLSDSIALSSLLGVDVQLTGAVNSVVAGPGATDTTVTYRVTVTNDGPNTATGISIADTITVPGGVTITNTPNWNVGTLAPSASTTIDVVFEVDGSTANSADSISIGLNASSVETELAGADNVLSDSIALSSVIGVDVQLAGAVNSVVAGPGATDTTVTYRVTVTNDGPNTATGISIADTITVPGGVTITNTPNWNVGTLAPSASTTIDVVFEVDGSTANSADSISIGLNASSVETELAGADNVLSDSIALSSVIGVDVQLAGAVNSVVAGPGATDTTVTYRVTVTNDGPNTATGISIADTITVPGGVTITNTPNWNVGTLAPSASTTIDVVFEVDGSTANSTDSISIGLIASSVETELAAVDNVLSDSIALSSLVGVDVQLAGAVNSIVAGPGVTDTTVTYRVTVTNDGPSTATGINIADTITVPTGVTITNTPNWNVGTLAANASTTIDVVFEVDGSAADPTDSIAIGLVASSVETELATADNTLNDSIDLGTGGVPAGLGIRGSTWTVAYDDFALNMGANAALPWFNLNTIRITYANPLPVAPTLVLQGPTNGSTVATTLTGWNGTTATHTFANLTRGFYRAGSANVAVDFSVVPGDSSRGGSVDFFDLSFMAPLIGSNGLGPVPHVADYNGNGGIDFFDLSFMAPLIGTNLGGFVPPTGNPPPPPPMSPVSADIVWASLVPVADQDDEDDNAVSL